MKYFLRTYRESIIRANNTTLAFTLCYPLFLFVVLSVLPQYSYAGWARVNLDILGYPLPANMPKISDDPTAKVLRAALGFVTSGTGKAICTLAVIIAGMGALFHRITWIQALVITSGVGVVFGASNLLTILTGDVSHGMNSYALAAPGGGAVLGTCDNIGVGGINMPLNRACDMLRNTINVISGGYGATLATVCILFLGFATLFGKVTFPQALVLGVGIALVYGSIAIVNILWAATSHTDCLLNQALALITGHEMEFVFCRFLAELRGDSARFMATLAIIFLGFMAMLGRLSYATALVCLAGIAAVFGSDAIVNLLVPNSASCNNLFAFNLTGAYGAIEGVLCNILNLITGTPGKALASAAIVMLGFGAMLGKVSFGSALIVSTGIAIAFGAPQIIFMLTSMVDMCALSVTFSLSLGAMCSGSVAPIS